MVVQKRSTLIQATASIRITVVIVIVGLVTKVVHIIDNATNAVHVVGWLILKWGVLSIWFYQWQFIYYLNWRWFAFFNKLLVQLEWGCCTTPKLIPFLMRFYPIITRLLDIVRYVRTIVGFTPNTRIIIVIEFTYVQVRLLAMGPMHLFLSVWLVRLLLRIELGHLVGCFYWCMWGLAASRFIVFIPIHIILIPYRSIWYVRLLYIVRTHWRWLRQLTGLADGLRLGLRLCLTQGIVPRLGLRWLGWYLIWWFFNECWCCWIGINGLSIRLLVGLCPIYLSLSLYIILRLLHLGLGRVHGRQFLLW